MNLVVDSKQTRDYKIVIDFIKDFNFQRKDDQGDDLYIFSDVEWSDYSNLLESIGDISWCRISYLDGLLEIMAPGRNHERIKEFTGSLIVTYCDQKEIDYFPFGSTTLKNEEFKVGKEPDTSYAIEIDKQVPDIAVEVNQTSGSINDLEKYKRLGIQEVWMWDKKGKLEFYILTNNEYRKSSKSKFLKVLDSKIVQKHVEIMKEQGARIGKKEFIKTINSL